MSEIKEKMDKSLEALTRHFAGLRTGRANPGLIENIQVDAYGGSMPLNQLGSINIPDNRMLSITPFDQTIAGAIEKAISSSSLGLSAKNEGNILYIRLPELTEERRKELSKVAKTMAEEAKIAVRNIRRESIDEAKKSEEYSEDELKGYQNNIQKITDDYNHKIEELLKNKENEIFEI